MNGGRSQVRWLRKLGEMIQRNHCGARDVHRPCFFLHIHIFKCDDSYLLYLPIHWYLQLRPNDCIPSREPTEHLKLDGWNTSFLLERPIFRGYLSSRLGTSLLLIPLNKHDLLCCSPFFLEAFDITIDEPCRPASPNSLEIGYNISDLV